MVLGSDVVAVTVVFMAVVSISADVDEDDEAGEADVRISSKISRHSR